MSVFYKVRNLSAQPYLLLGLDVEGSLIQSHVPVDGQWHDLYDDVGLNYRRNTWRDIQDNVDLRKGVLDGDLEIDVDYGDFDRGLPPDPSLRWLGTDTAATLRLAQVTSASPAELFVPANAGRSTNTVTVLPEEDGLALFYSGTGSGTWVLPDSSSENLGNGWGVQIRNTSVYNVTLQTSGSDHFIEGTGPTYQLLLPGQIVQLTLVDDPNEGLVFADRVDSIQTETALQNPPWRYWGRVEKFSQLPPAPPDNRVITVYDDGGFTGTYYSSGGVWIQKTGTVSRSGHELADQMEWVEEHGGRLLQRAYANIQVLGPSTNSTSYSVVPDFTYDFTPMSADSTIVVKFGCVTNFSQANMTGRFLIHSGGVGQGVPWVASTGAGNRDQTIRGEAYFPSVDTTQRTIDVRWLVNDMSLTISGITNQRYMIIEEWSNPQ